MSMLKLEEKNSPKVDSKVALKVDESDSSLRLKGELFSPDLFKKAQFSEQLQLQPRDSWLETDIFCPVRKLQLI